MFPMQFEIEVREGEYALIDVIDYYPGDPGSTWQPSEDEEAEYEILDLQGNPAPYLQEFIDEDVIYDKIHEAIEDDRAEAMIANYEYRNGIL